MSIVFHVANVINTFKEKNFINDTNSSSFFLNCYRIHVSCQSSTIASIVAITLQSANYQLLPHPSSLNLSIYAVKDKVCLVFLQDEEPKTLNPKIFDQLFLKAQQFLYDLAYKKTWKCKTLEQMDFLNRFQIEDYLKQRPDSIIISREALEESAKLFRLLDHKGGKFCQRGLVKILHMDNQDLIMGKKEDIENLFLETQKQTRLQMNSLLKICFDMMRDYEISPCDLALESQDKTLLNPQKG